ncbi:MAG: Rv3654c family TadE-like protein [Propionibacteriaceae bacterium]
MITKAHHGQQGSGTMLTVGIMTVFLMFGALGAVLGGYAMAAHGARAAADLTALAAAQSMNAGDQPCRVAEDIAERNHAELTGCTLTGTAGDFVVAVSVRARVRFQLPGLPSVVNAHAWAGVAAVTTGH